MTATTTATTTASMPKVVSARQERPELRLVVAVGRKELRDAMRDRWLWLYTVGFAVLAITLTSLALSDSAVVGTSRFGRTAASLIALVQLVVPLMGLTIGARAISAQRESGTLAFLLGHPVSRVEAFLGIALGTVVALLAAVAAGFGAAGVLATVRSSSVDAVDLLVLAALSWLLAVAMVGVGMLVSVLARRAATALGMALVAWLALVFLGDLGLMGTAVATRVPESGLFFAAVANPVEAFRLTAMSVLDGSLDVLGPVGTYAVDQFGGNVRWVTGAGLLLWVFVPFAIGLAVFRRGSDL
jgi:Cu-processing system permease protein